MKYFFFGLLLLAAPRAMCQDCTCAAKLAFFRQQVESNYAGFDDKVTGANRAGYIAFTTKKLAEAARAETPQECMIAIHDWLAYFRDGHIQGGLDDSREDDTVALRERIRNTEYIDPAAAALALQRSADPVEGVYTSDDSAITIAVIKSKKKYRDYAGVVLASSIDTWHPGQVKLELGKRGKDSLLAVLYLRDHTFKVQDYSLGKDNLNEEWIKASRKPPVRSLSADRITDARKIGDHTLYIKMQSFNGSVAAEIDSLFKALTPLLSSMPHLIIDIRDNGGGSDFSYRPVIPWLYTNPIVHTGVDVRCTQDNIDGWKKVALDNPDVPADLKQEARILMDSMRVHKGSFISTGPDDTTVMSEVRPNPRKTVILINGGCASSAEQFIFVAKQSKKVTIMGCHSRGVLDYANMRPCAQPPCSDIILWYATTRSRRINLGKGIDNVGIMPDVTLSAGKDWVAEAVKYMDGK